MEVMACAPPDILQGWTHSDFPIDDASRVGEARRFAAHESAAMGWNGTDSGRLSLVVTELATNLHRHAKGGRLLIASIPQRRQVEVIAIDHGPGIPDLHVVMRDGYSTGGSPGTGLGAVRRLADAFDIHSTGQGTVCVARVEERPLEEEDGFAAAGAAPRSPGTAHAIRIGAICLPLRGEAVCGDGWAMAIEGERIALCMADGLGHGPEAARASQGALEVFAQGPFSELGGLADRMHLGLQSTRGAAVCSLRWDDAASPVHSASIGNVSARLVSGVEDRSIPSQHGTVGLHIRKAREIATAAPAYAMLIVHTDGIETRWPPGAIHSLLGRDPTLVAALLLRDHHRARDDATVVVVQRAG
ncbi:ATP-binding protein/SpoIIE family protein phosphatase [Acidovorax sp. GBBC 3334]|nr:ATP-binding SpoIIE family protein phosphatase [Acidovorax sp. GBBC 3334]MDA8455196.1 ATP-binding protein/SpoIIE family protein phosphatase [Acidovorax sp. GBBC 3334]